MTFAARKLDNDLSKDFAAGTATLFFGALLGGVANMLIADFDRRRVRRAADIEYVLNVLADLKAVYDTVDRGRTLISAHRSAKTYGDEMKNFIEARVKLLQVERALRFDERGSSIEIIRSEVSRMGSFLRLLVEEFQHKSKETSRAQSVYEARMKKALDQLPVSQVDNPPLPANTPWGMVSQLRKGFAIFSSQSLWIAVIRANSLTRSIRHRMCSAPSSSRNMTNPRTEADP